MDSELWGHTIFKPKNGQFAANLDFLHKSINVISIYLFDPIHWRKFKKIARVNPVLLGHTVFRRKMAC